MTKGKAVDDPVQAPGIETQYEELTFRFENPLCLPQQLVGIGFELKDMRNDERIHAFTGDGKRIHVCTNSREWECPAVLVTDDQGEVMSEFFPNELVFRA